MWPRRNAASRWRRWAARLPGGARQRLFRTRAEDALPYVVAHRRIYILPSRRGWAFLLALLIMLVAAVNYALSLGFALAFLLTGLFSATLLHTYRNLAGIVLGDISPGTALPDEGLEFRVMLANRGRFDRWSLCVSAGRQDDPGARCTIDVPAGQQVEASLRLPAIRRGFRPLGRLTLSSDYPLGLWRAWSYIHVPVAGLVFPRPEPHPPPLPGLPGERAAAATSHAMRGDIAGLRGYLPGDSPSSIAWKAAARGLGLHVKLFDDDHPGARLVLSLPAAGAGSLEQQLSRLAAWLLEAEARSQDYALELPGVQIEAAHGPRQRLAALSALGRYGFET